MPRDDDMPRCTDDKLFQLCNDFNDHMEKFDEHVQRFEDHETREEEKFIRLVEAQQKNTDAISELTGQVSSLVTDTKDIIQIHRDFQGAARIGTNLQSFLLWLAKWGVIGGALAAAGNWMIEHLPGLSK